MTQPVYEFSLFEKFCKRIAHVTFPDPGAFCLWPVTRAPNSCTAKFRQVPYRIRLRQAPRQRRSPREGVRIAQEALRQSRSLAQATTSCRLSIASDPALGVL